MISLYGSMTVILSSFKGALHPKPRAIYYKFLIIDNIVIFLNFMSRILLVEDDAILNLTVSQFLRSKGNFVMTAFHGGEALKLIDLYEFDLYILDVNLPVISGTDLVQHVRKINFSSPIIMMTASVDFNDFKDAYHHGCNEYIRKPFYLEELNIRLRKLLPDNIIKKQTINISPSISYDLENDELIVDGVTRRLRKKEKRLISFLVKNCNKTIPFVLIESYVWENEIKESYPLRQLLNDLRKHFGENSNLIRVDRGVGYRLEVKNSP